MAVYTRYAARTGRIMSVIDVPATDEVYDEFATLLLEGEADGTTHYVVDGILTERPPQSTVVDRSEISVAAQESAFLTLLPIPCRIAVTGPEFYDELTVEDGAVDFKAVVPGEYTIRVEAFPYLPKEITINAV